MASSNSPCAACKFLRRKCTQGCVFAPHFPSENPQKFANVHRVFGASNVAKLLNELNMVQREDAVNSLAYEADARLRDPVYGCFGYVYLLQHKLHQIHQELDAAKKELASYIGPTALGPATFLPFGSFGNAAPQLYHQPHFALASTSGVPFGVQAQQSQMLQQQQQQLAAAREQEMMRSFEHDLLRYNGGNLGLTQSYDSGQFHMHPQQQQPVQIQYLEHQQQAPPPRRAGSDEGRSQTGNGGGGALSS